MKLLISDVEPDLEHLFRVPDDFDACSFEQIKIFAERLTAIRIKRKEEAKEPKISKHEFISENVVSKTSRWGREVLARVIGKHPQMVYKYEKGLIKNIPLKQLRKICYYYDVTPHYILGYTKDEHKCISFKERKIEKQKCNNQSASEKEYDYILEVDENGNPLEFDVPMWFAPLNVKAACKDYQNLSIDDMFLFELINRFIKNPKEKQELCAKILNALLDVV